MKKILIGFAVLIPVVILIIFFNIKTTTYIVNFYNDNIIVETQEVKKGSKLNSVEDIEKEGYYFSGWYHEDIKWSFDDNVLEDMNLYATWTSNYLYGLSFNDKEVTYDGNEHYILLDGELNSNLEVVYENNGQINFGTYNVIAVIKENDKEVASLSATLSIKAAEMDIDNITLDSKTVTYNGQIQSLELNGELNDDITITYLNNENINFGVYEVTVKLSNEFNNYNEVELKATLTIEVASIIVSYQGDTYFEANNQVQKNIKAIYNDLSFEYEYSGEMIEAGKYTLTISTDNDNYKILNPSLLITIYDDYQVYSYDNITYIIENDEITITGLTSDNIYYITIPEYIDNIKVTSIEEEAFTDSLLKVIYVSSGIELIEESYYYIYEDDIEDVLYSNYSLILEHNGIIYALKENELTLITTLSSNVNLVIPNSINNYPVSIIGEYAFYYHQTLLSLSLPNNLKVINEYAFYYCSFLTEVILPISLSVIGDFAFSNCRLLTAIEINDLSYLGRQAFSNCRSLISVELNGVIDNMSTGVFTNCLLLENVTILSLESIPDSTFSNCISLTKIEIPSSVKTIYEYAFYGCSFLKEVQLSEGLVKISDEVFHGCTSLEIINLPNSLTEIGSYTFYNCSELREITITKNVVVIGENAFGNSSSLVIYCNVSGKLEGWHDNWASGIIVIYR
ncbi:MAG: leucine-rich repeat protein [bacterium]